MGDFGTVRRFEAKEGDAGGGGMEDKAGKAVVQADGASKEVLQVPVNNGGRTDAYVWTQVICVVLFLFHIAAGGESRLPKW